MQIISIKKISSLILFSLILVVLIGAASAHDDLADNSTDLKMANDKEDIISANGTEPEVVHNATFKDIPKRTNYLTRESFTVGLKDKNGTSIANRTVYFNVNKNIYEVTTDEKGIAKFPLANLGKGTYVITFIFNETGYNPIKASKKIFLLTSPDSAIKASTSKGYAGVRTIFKVTLTADGMPLAGRTVKFIVEKKTYFKKTNSKGEASVAIYMTYGYHNVKYFYMGEERIKSTKGITKVRMTYLKNPYNTKLRTVVIDADGGFKRSFLLDVARKLRTAGWKVILKGIGPEQHSINYYKVKNAVYLPFYNGMCAATIKEMGYSYYGGLIKAHKSVLATAFYTKRWTDPHGMLPYRYDITKLKFLKRAWDDNFSPSSFRGLYWPAAYMTNHDVRYCVGDTSYMIVEQFLFGGWVAHH